MRQFYRLFSIGHTVCDQLSWSHYRCLLPIKNSNECNYYINQVILNHLSVFILTFIRKTVRQILTFHFWNIEIICYLVYNYFRLVKIHELFWSPYWFDNGWANVFIE